MLVVICVGCGDPEASTNEIEYNNENEQNDENDNGNNDENDNDEPNQTNNNNEQNDKPTVDCDAVETIVPRPAADPEDDPCRPDEGWDGRVVYVATHGDDDNDGTLPQPVATIGTGLDIAEEDPEIDYVLVESGSYEESLVVRDGVHIRGSYTSGFAYSQGARARIDGGNPTVWAEDISSPTSLMSLRIEPAHDLEVEAEQTVVTFYAENADGLNLENLHLFGARAGDGVDGTDGIDGAGGVDGAAGADAPGRWGGTGCNWNDDVPGGAATETPECPGGRGGRGGDGKRWDEIGDPGQDGQGGNDGGGDGGLPGDEAMDGEDGGDGDDGITPPGGEGGVADGEFEIEGESIRWVGADGTDGEDGEEGAGGGGGGAGGGQSMGTCNRWGAAGGGGGSGGCGGTGGTAGTFGGAAVTLFLHDSDPQIRQLRIEGGIGGDGGYGGIGGKGGSGGLGAPGGEPDGDAGAGGSGGNGGAGGDGSDGGGGAGGPSFAIFSTEELSTDLEDSLIEVGSGGRGGGPAGDRTEGSDGAVAAVQIGLDVLGDAPGISSDGEEADDEDDE